MCITQCLFFKPRARMRSLTTSMPETSPHTPLVTIKGNASRWYAYAKSPTAARKLKRSYQMLSLGSLPYSLAIKAKRRSPAERMPTISKGSMCRGTGTIRRPVGYDSTALPTELPRRPMQSSISDSLFQRVFDALEKLPVLRMCEERGHLWNRNPSSFGISRIDRRESIFVRRKEEHVYLFELAHIFPYTTFADAIAFIRAECAHEFQFRNTALLGNFPLRGFECALSRIDVSLRKRPRIMLLL